MLIAGASAYPREIDFKRIREIVDEHNIRLYQNMNNLVNADYLWLYFQGRYDDLRSLASGNNQPNLNAEKIKTEYQEDIYFNSPVCDFSETDEEDFIDMEPEEFDDENDFQPIVINTGLKLIEVSFVVLYKKPDLLFLEKMLLLLSFP